MARATISDLPNEVIQQIILYLPPASIAGFQQVCSGFNALVEPLLWRYYCQTLFRYWSPDHHIKQKFSTQAKSIDWKTIYGQRHMVDRITSTTLDSILACQAGRIEKFQTVVEFGYDAKDCLLRHLRCNDDAEDVLARRYYADAVLGCLHRTMAIQEWSDLAERKEVSLERALGAYDMFVLGDREGDFDEISVCLDTLAEKILNDCPKLLEQSTRQKAISVATYLRSHNLIGLKDLRNYHNLENNFIGIALNDNEHPSLPLISVGIYCCVARRLGLDASPCGFPFHVCAIVKPPRGADMDGSALLTNSSTSNFMYMDPFRSDQETPRVDLQAQLRQIGTAQRDDVHLLDAASVSEIVLRTGRNILASVQTSYRNPYRNPSAPDSNDHTTLASFVPDTESAFYAALWASLLLEVSPGGDGPVVVTAQRRNYLPHIVEQFEKHFPSDVSLIERHILPLFQQFEEYPTLRDTIRVMRAGDSMPKQVKPRTAEISQHVKYRVGQVFRHKRYNYIAVITGWDVECSASEQWIARMRVNELPNGRDQSFYHVLGEDKAVRYVAQENIEIITPDIPHNLMPLAGRHFKRWDKETRTFVSNIKDEYPDD